MERIEISRPDDLPGVEIMAAWDSGRVWKVLHHTYTVSTIYASVGGSETIYRGRNYLVAERVCALFEPGEAHDTRRVHGPGTFRVALIDPARIIQAGEELGLGGGPPHLSKCVVGDPRLYRAFRRLHAALERSKLTLERQSHFAGCVRMLLENYAESGSRTRRGREIPRSLGRAQNLLDERFRENVSLEELAREAGMSRYHLARAFRRRFGLPPHEYLLQRRIAAARGLLKHSIPPGEAAAELGFADQSHFTRCFKRIVGTTPAAYARA